MSKLVSKKAPPAIARMVAEALEIDVRGRAEAAPAEIGRRPQRIGDILLRMGVLTQTQIDTIAETQSKTGDLFGKVALRKGYIKPQDIQAAIAVQFGYFHTDPTKINIPPKLITITKPFSPEAEQFRMLRTRLVAQSGGAASKLLSISGATDNVGAAYTAANLAVAFAQVNRKVLLIDADLRKPQLAKVFQVKPKFGLTELLNDECSTKQAMCSSQIRNLTLLTAGARAHNPQELLGLPKFAETVMSSLDHFDSVLIQTPGGHTIADGQFVWALTKSVMMLARRNDTKSRDLVATADLIRECGAHIIGTVLTG